MTQPNLNDGTTTVTLKIDTDIPEQEELFVVSHNVPTRSGNVMQFMGRGSKVIRLDGYTTTQSEKNQLRDWARESTALVYNDDENSSINVRILDFQSRRLAGVPNYYRYIIILKEDE